MIKKLLLFVPLMLALFASNAAALVPYDTYTYSYWGDDVFSPHAYVPKLVMHTNEMECGSISGKGEIDTGSDGKIYAADTEGDRLVIFDNEYRYLTEIKAWSDPEQNDRQDKLNKPRGVFIHPKDGRIFVADTKNNRIVVFNPDFSFQRIIPEPVSSIFPEGFLYEPSKIAVDYDDRVYVVCDTVNMGIIEITIEGQFRSFVGAQKVDSGIAGIWALIETAAQRERRLQFVPTEYNNISVDEKGLLYVTTGSVSADKLTAAINSRSSDGKHMPLKKINYVGNDILARTSFFPPAGDIQIPQGAADISGPSIIVDVALCGDGTYSILDQKRGKIFSYDRDGQLLYAFGGIGIQEGLSEFPAAITYQASDILLLDGRTGKITVFERTEYGKQIHTALKQYRDREYDKAQDTWRDIIAENSNLDIAYLGLGKAAMFSGDYTTAMTCFRTANDTEYYSKAYELYRKNFLNDNYIWIILIVAAVGAGVAVLSKIISKVNKKRLSGGGVGSQVCYGFHTWLRPISGFWDFKHEKRGGFPGALIILAVAVAASLFRSYGLGYLFKGYDVRSLNPISIIAQLLLPLLMWVAANWCLTSLMDGEGRMKEILAVTCYALLPYAVLTFSATVVSNFISLDEQFVLVFIDFFIVLWTGLLIFFGMMSVHNYSLLKNILSCVLTIAGIGIIVFIILLCLDMTGIVYGFIFNIVKELWFR